METFKAVLLIVTFLGLPILIYYAYKSDLKDREIINNQIRGFLELNGFWMVTKTMYITKIKNSAIFIDGQKLIIHHEGKEENLRGAPLYELVGFLLYNDIIDKNFKKETTT